LNPFIFSAHGWSISKIQDADGDTYLCVEKTADEDKIHGVVKGVEAFLIHDSGILDYPKQSAAKVYPGVAVQSIPHNTITQINFENEVFDVQNEFDLTTDRFTALEAGYYLVVACTTLLAINDGIRCNVYVFKNGAMEAYASLICPKTGENPHPVVSTVVYLDGASDYLDIRVYHKHGSARNIHPDLMETNAFFIKVA